MIGRYLCNLTLEHIRVGDTLKDGDSQIYVSHIMKDGFVGSRDFGGAAWFPACRLSGFTLWLSDDYSCAPAPTEPDTVSRAEYDALKKSLDLAHRNIELLNRNQTRHSTYDIGRYRKLERGISDIKCSLSRQGRADAGGYWDIESIKQRLSDLESSCKRKRVVR